MPFILCGGVVQRCGVVWLCWRVRPRLSGADVCRVRVCDGKHTGGCRILFLWHRRELRDCKSNRIRQRLAACMRGSTKLVRCSAHPSVGQTTHRGRGYIRRDTVAFSYRTYTKIVPSGKQYAEYPNTLTPHQNIVHQKIEKSFHNFSPN